jgi:Lar family restriction alleviation protein
MNEELKPCPFCGHEAEMLNYSEDEWLVYCPASEGMVERWRETEAEAIEQWNRRANDGKSTGR